MTFRKDINALRALAVLAVAFYHFGLPGFAGGFVGVDVFFVISGYLMTSIILTGIEKDKFSVLSFYWARAKRIVPALAAVCIALLAFGWYWIAPIDFAQTGKHVAAALGFYSNFTFQGEKGYFDTLSKDKWLLHTWSLSVEWQFYLLYPFLILFLQRKRLADGGLNLRRMANWLGGVAAFSLVLSILVTPKDSAFAFFLLPTRMWELLGGAFVFLALRAHKPSPRWSRFATLWGLLLIACSILAFDAQTSWPGYLAVMPVLGAMAILWGARQKGVFAGNPLLQAVGTWSYSIYLWHWPLFVGIRTFGHEQDVLWQIGGLALSIALGAVSYYLIESPIREAAFLKTAKRKYVWRVVAVVAFIAAVGLGAQHTNGYPFRVDEKIRVLQNTIGAGLGPDTKLCKGEAHLRSTLPACQDKTPDYVVWGDSHAAAVFNAIREAAGNRYGEMYYRSCPPLAGGYVDTRKWRERCRSFATDVLADLKRLPPSVPAIVVFRLSYYILGNTESDEPVPLRYTDISEEARKADPVGVFKNRLTETLCAATQGGRKVYVLAPIPEMGVDVPRTLSHKLMTGETTSDITLPRRAYDERHKMMYATLERARSLCGIRILDPRPFLCDTEACYGSRNFAPVYYDDDHLGQEGSRQLVPLFRSVWDH